MAKKRRAVSYYNSIKVARREWKADLPEQCMSCLRKMPDNKLETHEIERKSHLHNRWWPESGCNGLKLCHECHAGPFATMEHSRQLTFKLIHDPDHFDLQEWLSLKPRPWSYCTMSEIMEHVKDLL